MIKRKQLALACGLVLASPMTMAAVSDADFQALKDSIAVLTQKLNSMEQELAAEKARSAQQPAVAAAPAPAPSKPASSWADKVTIQGDLRGRYENIDTESNDDRNRDRIRARAAIIAKPQDGLEVGFGLATAQDNDPVSSNQTIGNGGSRKDIYLDLAYFNWQAAEGLNAIGGKFKNNLYRPGKHGLVWDSDLNPEGLALTYVNGAFFANAMGTWVESDSSSSRSEAVGIGGQLGVVWPLGDDLELTAGAGYFSINSEGKGPFYGTSLFGNTAVGGRYAYDYDDIEGFAELGFRLLGQPAMVFVDYVKNSDADEFDTGWPRAPRSARPRRRAPGNSYTPTRIWRPTPCSVCGPTPILVGAAPITAATYSAAPTRSATRPTWPFRISSTRSTRISARSRTTIDCSLI